MAETKKRLDERTIGRIPVAASFASSSAGSDTYAITLTPAPTAYETGRVYIFKADVANTGAATLNVNALGAKTIKKNSTSDLADNDILAGSIITCIYDGTNMQAVSGLTKLPSTSYFGGTGADGAIDGSANVTITGSNDTYIEKNYTSIAAASGSKTFTITPTNCVLHVKVSGNADFTGWTINLNSKGGPAGSGGSGGASPSAGGSGTPGKSYVTNTGTAGSGAAGQYAGSVTTLTSAGGTAGEASGIVGIKEAIAASKVILIAPGGGGAGGGGGYSPSDNAAGGAGGAGGGCILIEVAGNITFSGTTITATGANGSVGATSTSTYNTGGGGGGGGGGGSVVILYGGTITGSNTPTVTGGNGALGGLRGAAGGGTTQCSGAGGAGGGSAAGKGTSAGTVTNVSSNDGIANGGTAGTAGYYLITSNKFVI